MVDKKEESTALVSQSGEIIIPAIAEDSRTLVEKKVRALVRAQRKLPAVERRMLIRCDPKYRPSEAVVKQVDALVEMTGIPYNLVYVIQTKAGIQIAPMADGWYQAARMDPRGLVRSIPDAPNVVTIGNKTLITARHTLQFRTGEIFSETQNKVYEEEKDRNPDIRLQDVINKATTQARGKAAEAAVGLPFPGVAEEIIDWELKPVKAEVRTVTDSPVKNLGQLLARCYGKYKLVDRKIITKLVGVEKLEEIKDFAQATDLIDVHMAIIANLFPEEKLTVELVEQCMASLATQSKGAQAQKES